MCGGGQNVSWQSGMSPHGPGGPQLGIAGWGTSPGCRQAGRRWRSEEEALCLWRLWMKVGGAGHTRFAGPTVNASLSLLYRKPVRRSPLSPLCSFCIFHSKLQTRVYFP